MEYSYNELQLLKNDPGQHATSMLNGAGRRKQVKECYIQFDINCVKLKS